MSRRKMIPLASLTEVPPDMNEADARAFWDSHEVTETYLAAAGPPPDADLPPTRAASAHIALRVPMDTLRRLKAVAQKKKKGYQTLL